MIIQGIVTSDSGGVEVRENRAKGGIEIKFATRPDDDMLATIKSNGFRWSSFNKLWYAHASEKTREFAYSVASGKLRREEVRADYFDMAVEDNMADACGL